VSRLDDGIISTAHCLDGFIRFKIREREKERKREVL